jgi:hypothetical protein
MSRQLALYRTGPVGSRRKAAQEARRSNTAPQHVLRPGRLCAACQEREARYGFRDSDNDDPTVERPRTLCFACFRMEMDRRRAAAEQLARGWNATQAELPLAGKLDQVHLRRRRAQIAARHALGLK